jgi:hypothetical protein
MIISRTLLTLGISIVSLLISYALDSLLAPLTALPQFLIQIPILVLLMDELRRLILSHASAFNLSADDVNGAFFFAAPMAAFGARSLFRDLQLIHKGNR